MGEISDRQDVFHCAQLLKTWRSLCNLVQAGKYLGMSWLQTACAEAVLRFCRRPNRDEIGWEKVDFAHRTGAGAELMGHDELVLHVDDLPGGVGAEETKGEGIGERGGGAAGVEVTLHKFVPGADDGSTVWRAFARPAKKLRRGDIIDFAPDLIAEVIEKREAAGRARTMVRALSPSERTEEIARMLGGKAITETTRRAAKEMLRLDRTGSGSA